MTFRGFIEKIIVGHLQNRMNASEKIEVKIAAHDDGFEIYNHCIEDGYFLVKVYSNIPLSTDIETNGEAIAVIKLNSGDLVHTRVFNECWSELVDINQAQFETYLEFGSLSEVKDSINYNLSDEDRLESTKHQATAIPV